MCVGCVLGCVFLLFFRELQKKISTISNPLNSQNPPQPMNNLGFLYQHEENDIENALKWYTKAVELGNKTASFNMAYLYEYTLKDLKTAEFWYKKAANAGHKEAIERMKKNEKNQEIG